MYLDGKVRIIRASLFFVLHTSFCKSLTDRIMQILLQQPFRERRELLRSRFPPLKPQEPTMAYFDHVRSCESEEGRAALEEFWELALNSRTEGLMIKVWPPWQFHDVD